MKKTTKGRIIWCLAALLTTAVCLFSCDGSKTLEGKWMLDEFCFGEDCIKMADHGMEQVWELSDEKVVDSSGRFAGTNLRKGHQYHAEVMDQDIVWYTSAQNDTLFVTNPQGTIADMHLVKLHGKDTMVLTSTLNGSTINQRFVRR